MIIFALYNMKGGVGKTTAAVNLAYLASRDGCTTLICDLDPQGSTSYYFRVNPKVKSGVKPLLKGRKHVAKNIKGTDYRGLDLLPADFSFRNVDLAFDQVKRSKYRLRDSFSELADQYDYVFLDSPPNLTLLSENIFNAADYILNPVQPSTLSLQTHHKMIDFFEREALETNKILSFFSLIDSRKSMHKESMKALRAEPRGCRVLSSGVPYLSDVERMGVFREPVHCFAANSPAAKAFGALWEEIKKTIVRV